MAHEHGEWQPWLAENFDLSYRTAVRYISAAEYVERKSKSDTVALFADLSPTVLYLLAEGHYSAKEEAAILAATREGRVDNDARSGDVGYRSTRRMTTPPMTMITTAADHDQR